MLKIEARRLKGFPDYLPKEQSQRQRMLHTIAQAFERYGFLPMSTPALEYKEILLGKYGDEEKLVYSFLDNGGREVALRYDLTVPLARFVAEQGQALLLPFKRYQIAPVWRAENTQKGRLREFYQCDIDIVGCSEFVGLADADVIACLSTALLELGVMDFQIHFSDRQLFHILASSPEETAQLTEALRCVDKLDKIGLAGVADMMTGRDVSARLAEQIAQLLAVGPGEAALEYVQGWNDEAAAHVHHWRQFISASQRLGLAADKLIFDPAIVRGLDYYDKLVFEIRLAGEGAGYGSIAGGGRYNGLLGKFSKRSLSAVGGSLGIDRLYEYLVAAGKLGSVSLVDVVVLNMDTMDTSTLGTAAEVVRELRQRGISTDYYYEPVKIEKQLKYVNDLGAKAAIFLGESERKNGVVGVRDMISGRQEEVMLPDVVSYVARLVGKI